ncbi:Xaa-Pro aminopeptidase 1 [Pseudoclavibacter triregionum]|nr:Xaa-Pro aminopeptidase 1 [Pseudoclavibacter triregionum]
MTQETTPRATANRSTLPADSAFTREIGSGWADRPESIPEVSAAAAAAAVRRRALSERHLGTRLVIPAGGLKQRSNDCDYRFRAHSAFTHLTGWGSEAVPDSVLVLEPSGTAHAATLYFRERATREDAEFYANPEIGEFWIGPRPSLAHVAGELGVETRHLRELFLDGDVPTILVREADPRMTEQVDRTRARRSADGMDRADELDGDALLEQDLSEMRLVKDDFEIGEIRAAVAATAKGFDDIIRELDRAAGHERGERIIEGAFFARARLEGNELGYETIAAAGPHACYLHWTRNDGPVVPGDLVLVDAGVEVDSLYTADITRTLPVDGTFTPLQRQVYEAVRAAADAAFAVVKPGITFRMIHETAMQSIAESVGAWGLLPCSVEEAVQPDGQQHRRWMVHGTSHHLGLDVHDCAKARRELYLDGVLEEGMVFTIEPGLYFQADDLTVPEEYRGIGVRIEDNILVTADGAENLSIAIPRTADDVEAWMARVRGERRA